MKEIKVYKDKIDNPVLEIQYYLNEISKFRPEIPSLKLNGIYDEDTKIAVVAFQNAFGLNITGTVDFNTWNKIVNEYLKYYNLTKAPSSICYNPPKTIDLKIGDEGNIVYVIQMILKNLSQIYKNYENVDITGIYDGVTSNVIREFQHCNALPITGEVDKNTWDTLIKIQDILGLNK